MVIRSYNEELAIANLMFQRIFNNIRIERAKNNGKTETVKVQCVLGQRSRILKNWQNADKRANMTLPMIIISRTGYSRNAERLNNLHNEVKYEVTSKDRKTELMTPVPVDLSYDVTVVAKNPSDIDQIASNFMIFFNSDIYVSCQHPKFDGIKLNNQVIMNDSVTEENPEELDGAQNDFITSTFQFTFKTYLFGGTVKAAKSGDTFDGFVPIIKHIEMGYYGVPNSSEFSPHMSYIDENFSKVKEQVSGYLSSDVNPDTRNYDLVFLSSGELVTPADLARMNELGENWYKSGDIVLSGGADHIAPLTLSSEASPYVDCMVWTIAQ